MTLRLPYPHSFLRLTLLGFVLAGLPLLAGLLYSAWSLEQLARDSQAAVYAAAQAAHAGRALTEEITAMERAVGQYAILGEPDLLTGYRQARQRFLATLELLDGLAWEPAQRGQVRALRAQEARLAALFAVPGGQGRAAEQARRERAEEGATRFAELSALARRVATQAHALIDRRAGRLGQRVIEARQSMAWMLVAALSAALLLALGLPRLIARPVRQIDAAIGRLRAGELNAPVRVEGPRDLEYVGQRLEWMRQGLLAAEADRTRFLRHLSHELKTPLTALREGTELLRDGVGGPLSEGQGELVDILRQNGLRLQKRIEDLLDYSALLSAPSRPRLAEVRVAGLVARVVGDHRAAILAKGLRVDTLGDPPDAPAWVADPEMLRVIVDNLLSNAIRFSPPGGRVGIRTEQKAGTGADPGGGTLILEVTDAGPGVSEEDKPRVFDAFYQGCQADEASVKGTGLGLSIAREYALAQGGRIEVLDAPGGGARFRVSLPALKKDEVE